MGHTEPDPGLTGCGRKAWDPLDIDRLMPVRICVAPAGHETDGLPHRWVSYEEWRRSEGIALTESEEQALADQLFRDALRELVEKEDPGSPPESPA